MVSVLLYLPNVIGYVRCVTMVWAFANWTDPRLFFTRYFFSFCLDAADGYAARYFKQSSEFGALLDMLTDRCGTAMLLVILAILYPAFSTLFMALMFLDCFSHWAQMSSGLCSGTSSHKKAGNQSALIRFYYTRPVLTFTCLFNELFFLMLYVLHHWEGPTFTLTEVQKATTVYSFSVFTWGFCLPVFLIKQVVNVKQIVTAHKTLLNAAPVTFDFGS